MSTELYELSREVWDNAFNARPREFSMVSGPWRSTCSKGYLYTEDEANSMIQASSVRWLLNGKTIGRNPKFDDYFKGGFRIYASELDYDGEEVILWEGYDKDFTIALLKAVNACSKYEMKRNKNGN